MDRFALRRRLTALGLSNKFSVGDLAEALARERGRPLRLRAEPLPVDGLSGGLVVTRELDFIAYQRHTSKLHQDHIVCHEFGHLLAGHETVTVVGRDAARLLAPHIDPAVVERILGRSCSSAAEEQEAEHIAYMLMSLYISSSSSYRETVVPDNMSVDIRNLLDWLGPGG
ncbi:hypothetical protein C5E45_23585 [Nocardia nova]|uniref:IrrE N-terminal-like domain-containing protein n=2 Tax=Nocardia nova TaxID=37330 RepID=A0A2S6AKN5_9NOCA|nr:hypothetical protein C5E45_23585 [Nocardia nova]